MGSAASIKPPATSETLRILTLICSCLPKNEQNSIEPPIRVQVSLTRMVASLPHPIGHFPVTDSLLTQQRTTLSLQTPRVPRARPAAPDAEHTKCPPAYLPWRVLASLLQNSEERG